MTATLPTPKATTTPAELTVDLKGRIARRFRRSSSATGIPQHVVMFEVPVDSVETRRAALVRKALDADDIARAEHLESSDAPFLDSPAKRRRIDALAVGQWGPVAGRLIGFEVKATRADLLTELRDPLKALAGGRYCHEWWLVVPHIDLTAGLELPPTWGVMARYGAGLKVHRAAHRLTPTPASPRLVAAIAASATTQAIPNDVRGLRTIAADLTAEYPHHPELKALHDRLEAQHRARFG